MSSPSNCSEANIVARLRDGAATSIEEAIECLYKDEQLRHKIWRDCIKPMKEQVLAAIKRLEKQAGPNNAATLTYYARYQADDDSVMNFLLRNALKRLEEFANAGDWDTGGLDIHRHCVCGCIGFYAQPVLAERERLLAYLRKVLSPKLPELQDPHQLEDILQEALSQFAERVYKGDYDPNRSSVSTYIVNLANSRYGSQVRTMNRWHTLLERIGGLFHRLWAGNGEYGHPEMSGRPDQALERRELLERLYARMSQQCRELLSLFALHYTSPEIAEKTGMSSHAVRQARRRCLQELRTYFERHPQHRKLLLEP